jgi:hypothetical protein
MIENIKQTIDSVLKSNTSIRKRKKSLSDLEREQFESLILHLEKLSIRTNLVTSELQINLESYDELFYNVIDNLIKTSYGEMSYNFIMYYIYERLDINGEVKPLIDNNGNEFYMKDVNDLWDMVTYLNK